jgi:hypothetical protein
MTKRRTHDEFVKELKAIQPKLKVIGRYINNKERILISDLNGKYLPCAGDLLRGTKPSITSSIDKTKYWINKAIGRHGYKYDYSRVNYTTATIKVCIICPIHGEFWQRPCDHMKSFGCNKCVVDNGKVSISEFIERSNKYHNYKYDYSKTVYVRRHDKVTIICPIHGEFKQIAAMHMNGAGCKKCATLDSSISKHEFIRRSVIKHKNKYDYSLVEYNSVRDKVSIICPKHGVFKQLAVSHMNGHGCRICLFERCGWNKSKSIERANGRMYTLYKIHCWNKNESFYKIGKTVQSVHDRFNSRMPYNYRVISELTGDAGYIYDLENKEKRRHKHLKYEPAIGFNGSKTECFTKLII